MLINGIAGGLTLIAILMIVGGSAVAISLLIENLKFSPKGKGNVQASSEKEHTVSV